jgi:hypothetical protein
MSSQINYVICLVDEINVINIIHWSLVKCKRIIRSVLAADSYAIIHEFDIKTIIKIILRKILSSMISRTEFEKKISRSREMISISRSEISLILYTNLKSLYDCLIRLNITRKKRLMIDVMRLRQLYKRWELIEIKWIHDHNNSIDFMTKVKASSVLKMIINENRINLNTTEWMKRH